MSQITQLSSMSALSKEMNSFAVSVQKARDASVREIILSVTEEEARSTPVDTGEARSNWLINQPNHQIPPHAPGRKLGRSEQANLRLTVVSAQSVVDKLANFEDGKVTTLSNAVDYMEKLVKGTSKQAGADFDEVALDRGLSRARSRVSQALRFWLGKVGSITRRT